MILDFLDESSLIIWVLKSGKPFLTGSLGWDGRRKRRDSKPDRLDWPWLCLKIWVNLAASRNWEPLSVYSQQENSNLGLTTSKNWILPTTWRRKEKKVFFPRASKKESIWHLDFRPLKFLLDTWHTKWKDSKLVLFYLCIIKKLF